MHPLIIIIVGVILTSSVLGQENCVTSSISACTNSNVQCINDAPSDPDKCVCIRSYAVCLEDLGCDPDEQEGGEGHNPGNANGQFDAIRQSCISYSCDPVGICEVKSPSSANVQLVAVIMWLLVIFFICK